MKLNKMSNDHLIFNLEKYKIIFKYTDKLCDFTIFEHVSQNPVIVAVMELKGGKGRIDEEEFDNAHKQLQNGASITDAITSITRVEEFIPCLVKGGGLSEWAARMLPTRKYKIQFRDFFESIKIMDCGESLKFYN